MALALFCLSLPAPVMAQSSQLANETDLPGDQGYLLGECIGWVQARRFSLTSRYTSRDDRAIQATLRSVGQRARRIERNFNTTAKRLVKIDMTAYSEFLAGYVRGLHAARADSLAIQLEHGEPGVLNVYDQVVIQCP